MFHDVGKEEDVKLFFFAQLRRFHAAQSITAIFPYDRGIQLHAKRFEAGGEQQSEISAVAAADVQDLRVRRSVFAQHAQDAVFFSPEAIQEFADSHTRSLNFAGRYCSSVTILFDGRLCPLGAMKILYITSAYPTYWADFYGRNPGIADQPYSSQKAAILRDAFAIGDSWTNGFRALGHEAEEIFTNAGPLQRAWWKENAGRAADAFDPATVVVAQAKRFGPDVLIYDEASESLLRTLRDAVPSLRLVFGWVGSAFPPDTGIFRQFDLVLSCAPESVERLREAGVSSEHLDHAFDSRLLERLGPQPPAEFPVTFVGQLIRGSEFHNERTRLLELLAERMDLAIFSEISSVRWTEEPRVILKTMLYHLYRTGNAAGLAPWMNKVPLLGRQKAQKEAPQSQRNPRLRPFLRPACYGLEMYRTLRRSHVTLNIHADSSPRFASNMRLFESTGVGSCLLTDWRDNLPALFRPDEEVVAYRSAEECVEKARWLLDHPEQAAKIAAAGQRRTLESHNYGRRVERLNALIRTRI
jgi:spore maturation protein CgeB